MIRNLAFVSPLSCTRSETDLPSRSPLCLVRAGQFSDRAVWFATAEQVRRIVVTEAEILTFVREAFRSVWVLELLLVLRRDPNRSWTIPDLVTALQASERIVADGLQALIAAGLAAEREAGWYRFSPASPVVAQIADELVSLHARKPVAVVRAILSAPNDKIRIFADAFRFNKGGRT
jgi:hypothetical protein